MRRFALPGAIVALAALSMPAQAGFISVHGTAIHDGSTIFDASATVDNFFDDTNPTYEFNGTTIPDFATSMFDFFEFGGVNYLKLYFQPSSSGGFAVMNDFEVEFSNFVFTDGPEFAIQGVSTSDDTTGLTPELDTVNGVLTLSFSNFEVSESRSIFLEFEIDGGDDTNAPVVPVPAAAPMGLLGLGVLALARRFRRKKS